VNVGPAGVIRFRRALLRDQGKANDLDHDHMLYLEAPDQVSQSIREFLN